MAFWFAPTHVTDSIAIDGVGGTAAIVEGRLTSAPNGSTAGLETPLALRVRRPDYHVSDIVHPTGSGLKTFRIKSGCRSSTPRRWPRITQPEAGSPNEDQIAKDASTGGRPFGRTHHTKVADAFNLSAAQSCDYLNATSATDCMAAIVHLSGTTSTDCVQSIGLLVNNWEGWNGPVLLPYSFRWTGHRRSGGGGFSRRRCGTAGSVCFGPPDCSRGH